MRKKFLKGIMPVLLVVIMCIVQLLPTGAMSVIDPELSDEEIAITGTGNAMLCYILCPELSGVSGANVASYEFDGVMTVENADRIIWVVLIEGMELFLNYVDEEQNVVIPEEVFKSVLMDTFAINNPDITLSSMYDPQRKAIVVSYHDLGGNGLDCPYFGFLVKSLSKFNYDITGNICRASFDFVNLDRSHSLQVSMEFEFSIEEDEKLDGYSFLRTKMHSFKVLQDNPLLELKSTADLHIEKEWFLCGAEEQTKVQDFESQFKQSNVSYWTVMNGDDAATKEFVGTGDMFLLTDSGNRVIDLLCAVIKGDINGDGKVTSTDYLQLKSYFKGNFNIYELSAYFEAADVDNDNQLDSTDYLRIKKYMNGTVNLYTDL